MSPRPSPRTVTQFAREVLRGWGKDNASMLAAALSFFTLFSLAPLLVIALAAGGVVFGEEASRQEIISRVLELAGPQAAAAIEQMLENIARPEATLTAGIVGFLIVLAGASGVFWQLRIALNVIWKVQPQQQKAARGIWRSFKTRLLTIGFALGVGLLLLISLAAGPVLTAISGLIPRSLPGSELGWRLIVILAGFVIIALVFALVFRYVPARRLPWTPVLVGGLFTSVLFNVGRELIGLYLGQTTVASAYGAAGSLVVFLVWIYYSMQILLLGGEFTVIYGRRSGRVTRA